MALGVVLLMPVWYVSSWVLVSRAAVQDHISLTTAKTIAPVFTPIVSYCNARRPGWKLLSKVWVASVPEAHPSNGRAFEMWGRFAPPQPEDG